MPIPATITGIIQAAFIWAPATSNAEVSSGINSPPTDIGVQSGNVPIVPGGHSSRTQSGNVPIVPGGHSSGTQIGNVPIVPGGHSSGTQSGNIPIVPGGHSIGIVPPSIWLGA